MPTRGCRALTPFRRCRHPSVHMPRKRRTGHDARNIPSTFWCHRTVKKRTGVEDLEKKGQRFEGSLKLKPSLNWAQISIPSLRKYQVWTLTGRSGTHPDSWYFGSSISIEPRNRQGANRLRTTNDAACEPALTPIHQMIAILRLACPVYCLLCI